MPRSILSNGNKSPESSGQTSTVKRTSSLYHSESAAFPGIYNSACILTLAGAFSAWASLAFAIAGFIEFSLVALILSGLADLFDGVVARRLQLGPQEREYGVQLDTVVDVFSFVATPALIGMLIVGPSIILSATIAAFSLAGLIRLAHFNTLSVLKLGSATHHIGLPVTYSALFLPLVFVFRTFVPDLAFTALLSGTFLAMALLFLLPMEIPKPRGIFYIFLPVLAACLISFWLWQGLHSNWS